MNLGSRPGHSYALLPSAARQLASLAFRSSHAFGEHMEAIAVGMMPGLVCARCGMTIFEIIAADVLCIETSPLSSTECLARKTAVRSMLECDLAGTPPYVCVDHLRELGDVLSAPPWRKETIRIMQDATTTRLQALMQAAGGALPVLGTAVGG